MNKLNVGDYIRTRQYIRKIRKIEQEYIYCDIGVFVESEIIKSSPNIIDLIEVGDYVNGHIVEDLDDLGYISLDDDTIKYDDIKSIVTKESFENISYKVGE